MTTPRRTKQTDDQPTLIGNPSAVAASPATTQDAQPAPTALVAAPSTALEEEENPWDLSAEELASVLEADGLGDAGVEDFRIGYWVFNVLNREVELPDGTKIKTRRDQWWNTLTNRVVDTLEGVFVGFRKTQDFSRYNNKINKTERFCSSNNRVTGTALADFSYKTNDPDGTERIKRVSQGDHRPCAKCPQQAWRTIKDPETGDTRQKQDCSLVRSLVFYEQGESGAPEPGVIRFKRSSARPVVDMLSRYFLGKWKVKTPKLDPRTKAIIHGPDGKPVMQQQLRSYPLYAFVFSISLAVDKSGNYAVPEFRKVRQCTHDEIMYWKSQAQFIVDMGQKVIEEADKAESAAGVGAEDDEQAAHRADDPDANGKAADEPFDRSRLLEGTEGTASVDDDVAF
jgi:hypothetical protein